MVRKWVSIITAETNGFSSQVFKCCNLSATVINSDKWVRTMYTRKEFQSYEFHIGRYPSTVELFIRQKRSVYGITTKWIK